MYVCVPLRSTCCVYIACCVLYVRLIALCWNVVVHPYVMYCVFVCVCVCVRLAGRHVCVVGAHVICCSGNTTPTSTKAP